jgi:hypothetical protein
MYGVPSTAVRESSRVNPGAVRPAGSCSRSYRTMSLIPVPFGAFG